MTLLIALSYEAIGPWYHEESVTIYKILADYEETRESFFTRTKVQEQFQNQSIE